MAEHGFIKAVHSLTGLVQDIPELWLSIYPQFSRVSDSDVPAPVAAEAPATPADPQEGSL